VENISGAQANLHPNGNSIHPGILVFSFGHFPKGKNYYEKRIEQTKLFQIKTELFILRIGSVVINWLMKTNIKNNEEFL